MGSEKVTYVFQTVGPFYLFLGGLALIGMVAILMIMRDARPAFVPFLLAVYAINVENVAAYLLLWGIRWALLVVLLFRSLRYLRSGGGMSRGLWIYLVLTFLSLLMAFHAPNMNRGLAISAIMFLAFFGVLFTIVCEIRDEYSFLRFVNVFVWVSLVITASAALMFAAGGFQVASTMGARLSGVFANPAVFAAGLALCVPVFVWRVINVRRWAKKAFYLGFFILASMLTFLTGSRGAIGFAVIAVTVIFARHNVRLILPLVLLLFFGVYVLLPFVQQMSQSKDFMAHVTGETGLTGRGELWQTAYDLVKERPLIGWGTGISTDLDDPTSPASSFHNAYLDSAVDLGILGPVLWILFYLIHILKAFKLCFSRYVSKEMRSACWLILGNLLALTLLAVFVGSPVSVTRLSFYWGLMNVAIVIAGERIVNVQRFELYADEELYGEEFGGEHEEDEYYEAAYGRPAYH